MRLTEEAITAAFDQHHRVYAQGKRWSIGHQIDLYNAAKDAFLAGTEEPPGGFTKVYKALRGGWQVFRTPKGKAPEAEDVYGELLKMEDRFRTRHLSGLTEQDILPLWDSLRSVEGIKVNDDGPSVVAISKFLHFWNPRLFVIVDSAVMWEWVLRHRWIKQHKHPVPSSL